jgi:Fic family protein
MAVLYTYSRTFATNYLITIVLMEPKLHRLPLGRDLESKNVLKALPRAHAALAELKGLASSIPNHQILINTLALQEAKDSSAIENIITTHNELFSLDASNPLSSSAKEVQNYRTALELGFNLLKDKGFIQIRDLNHIQSVVVSNNSGIRKLPGTALRNSTTGKVIYEPPQDHFEITELLSNLEAYINDPSLDDFDPLSKMAIIHYQFESIHPYYDGNGRTGRILNILYLILSDLQQLPVLYLSRYIIRNKRDYYRLLQEVRLSDNWEEWLVYMIRGIEETANETIALISELKKLMHEMKHQLRSSYKFYSQELLNNLFKYPYTKIEYIMNDLGVSRITATNYLNSMAADGILTKQKFGKTNYYVNQSLFELLTQKGF